MLFGQSNFPKPHLELILGYDNSISKASTPLIIGDSQRLICSSHNSTLKNFRVGTNIALPVHRQIFLTSGLRISTEMHIGYWSCSHPFLKVSIPPLKQRNVYLEIPFRTKFYLPQKNPKAHIYFEAGIDYRRFVGSLLNDDLYEKEPHLLFSNFSIGIDMKINKTRQLLFIQAMHKNQITPNLKNFDSKYTFVGFETGIRF